jgi:hypothetical protein
MAKQEHAVVLVLGAPGGRSFDATVQLGAQQGASEARAVALAAEALRDAAAEMARSTESEVALAARPAPENAERSTGPRVTERLAPTLAPRDEGAPDQPRKGHDFLGDIEPLIYARVYGGASTASTTPMAGLGTGLGLCMRRHCLFVAAELPTNTGGTEHLDVRYRYPTFLSGFYTRPFSFGRFTPGASIGFLTRLGHFEADMGTKDTGLDTDLGARGSLELAWEVISGLDLMTEGGADLTLDRQRMASNGDQLRNRGDRLSPWLQAALRYRP